GGVEPGRRPGPLADQRGQDAGGTLQPGAGDRRRLRLALLARRARDTQPARLQPGGRQAPLQARAPRPDETRIVVARPAPRQALRRALLRRAATQPADRRGGNREGDTADRPQGLWPLGPVRPGVVRGPGSVADRVERQGTDGGESKIALASGVA